MNFRAQPEFRVGLAGSVPAVANQAKVIKDSARASSRDIHIIPAFAGLGLRHFCPARNRMGVSLESRKPPTIIEARVELGPSHGLFVRGEGADLSWRKGTALLRVDPNTWIWVDDGLEGSVIFQLLLDDLIWARGENLALEAGGRIELTPDFEWPEIPRTY